MQCFKCQKSWKTDDEKIRFKDSCPYCFQDLHVCVNCKFYCPGKPNDCRIPDTEYVKDREKYNFCEDFKLKTNLDKPTTDPKLKFKSLFKDDL